MLRTRTLLPSVSRIALAIASLAAALHAGGATFLSYATRIAAEHQQSVGDSGGEIRPAKSPHAIQPGRASVRIQTVLAADLLVADIGRQPDLPGPQGSFSFENRERTDARQIRLSSVWVRAGPRSA